MPVCYVLLDPLAVSMFIELCQILYVSWDFTILFDEEVFCSGPRAGVRMSYATAERSRLL